MDDESGDEDMAAEPHLHPSRTLAESATSLCYLTARWATGEPGNLGEGLCRFHVDV